MSDQMPDEVWACPSAGVVCTGTWWSFQHEEDRNAVHYIRADLYEQAEAKRDRLRAALAAIEAMPYRVDRPLRLMDASRAAREALDHD